MSRHTIPSKRPNHTVVVGWDTGMASYFATVSEDTPDIEDDNLRLWIGGKNRECLRPEDLVARLAPYADLSPEMMEQLRRDRDAAPKRTALQQRGATIGEGYAR